MTFRWWQMQSSGQVQIVRAMAERRKFIWPWSVARSRATAHRQYTTIKALNGDWIKDKKIKILGQWALRPNPELPACPASSIWRRRRRQGCAPPRAGAS